MAVSVEPVAGRSFVGSVGTYGAGGGSQQAPSPTPHEQERGEGTTESLERVVRELNEAVRIAGTRISFTVDATTEKTVVVVTDADTGEIVRQIPSEEMLRLAAHIKKLMGVLFDEAF